MASVHDIAAYILELHGPMSAMKLQKLVYYSQAWSLAHRAVPLFDEQIEAWAHGPVVYDLFRGHRGQFVVGRSWPRGDSSTVTDEERSLIDSVIKCYGSMSAAQLSEMTHREDPWKLARAGIPDGESASAIITHEAMRAYYGSLAALLS